MRPKKAMPNPEGKGEVSKMGCVRVAHSKVLIIVSPNRVLLSNCNDYYNIICRSVKNREK